MPFIERHWQTVSLISVLLYPLSLVFCILVAVRRRLYRLGWLSRVRLPVPVIVVGNITVGGTGKTPLVIWIVQHLKNAGFRPGVVTRGYKGRSGSWPLNVVPETTAEEAGDEAVLLARRCACPVVAGPDRVADSERLLAAGCDVIVSDDGLQHYRLERDIEIAVLDGERRLGNGWCLPAGPLREHPSRLASVDFRMTTGSARDGEIPVTLDTQGAYRLDGQGTAVDVNVFTGRRIHAVAGIGNPGRFFSGLRAAGVEVIPHPFPDHHSFAPDDIEFGDDAPVLMTEKDAVKCQRFAKSAYWAVAVSARPGDALARDLDKRLAEIRRGQETA